MSDKTLLKEVSIRSLGVIENSNLEFGPGLNVVTGETGAGKTMILTAIELVRGGKSDAQLVRHGDERALVNAVFEVNKINSVDDYSEDGELILTRTISRDGKSKASAGGVTVSAATLESLANSLVEIHGQSANLSLAKASRQRELLDAAGGDEVEKVQRQYRQCFESYSEKKAHLLDMKRDIGDKEARIVVLEEFLAQGNKVKPKAGEIAELEDELSRLSSIEILRQAVTQAMAFLDGDESGAHSLLTSAKRALDSVSGKDRNLDKVSDALDDSFHTLTEVVHDLRRYGENLEADPVRLEKLQLRKAELNSLLKSRSKAFSDEGIDELISDLRAARTQLNDLAGGDNRISELEAELHNDRIQLIASAKELTSVRKKVALRLSDHVSEEIHGLAMAHTQFRVIVDHPAYDAISDSDFAPHGCDDISMEIQTHQGGPWLAIHKSASGGELSRIMLALEVVLAAKSNIGTYIFDEVDAGVGGSAAIEVGRRLAKLAESSQVIVVTHLPQVAAWATTHFTVKKESDGSVVSSGVSRIDGEDRIEEIARMLAGLGESQSAREHAAELLSLRT